MERTRVVGSVRNRRERRGATLILMTVAMVVLIGMAAFALDFGRMYLFRSQLQNAGDSAAWAGLMRLMVKDTIFADDTAAAYANRHKVATGFVSMPVTNAVPGFWNFSARTFTPAAGSDWSLSTNNAVRANVDFTASFVFGRIFGFTTRNVPAQAVAAFGFIGPTRCVRPWAIPYERMLRTLYPSSAPGNPYDPTYNLSQADIAALGALTLADSISLKLTDAGQTYVNGNFYGVQMGPAIYADGTLGNPTGGASRYGTRVGAPCDDPELQHLVGPGDWLAGENGNMQGPTEGNGGNPGVHSLCTLFGGGEYSVGGNGEFNCNTPVKVKAAIFDLTDTQCACGVSISPEGYRVKYIGEFTVYGYRKSTSGVIGYFNTMSTSGVIVNTPTPLVKPLLVQ